MATPAETAKRLEWLRKLRKARQQGAPLQNPVPQSRPKSPIRRTKNAAERLEAKRARLRQEGITPELLKEREFMQYKISRRYPEIARNFEPILRREPEKLDNIIKFLERNGIPVTIGNVLVRMKEMGIRW